MRAILLALILLTATPAFALTPTETVRARVDEVIQTINRGPRGGPAAAEARRLELRRVADGLFDFTEMSRRALGRHWAGRTEAERQDFVGLFADLLSRAYLGRIDHYSGEPITWVRERVDGEWASVDSRLVTAKGSEVPIEYRLRRAGDRWMVYDVAIEGVSLVGTYRSQFDRIIQTTSFGELLRRMRDKERDLTRTSDAR
ncbi:MAG TPA: ABC transporter substrate-binding protein [Methylomirabilota bacterium]|nr:ABC transporter substrate-binding protein [Methylomirabilota bacterium]